MVRPPMKARLVHRTAPGALQTRVTLSMLGVRVFVYSEVLGINAWLPQKGSTEGMCLSLFGDPGTLAKVRRPSWPPEPCLGRTKY